MPSSASLKGHPHLDQWLAITGDNKARVQTGKVDIGQRISTAILKIAAAELDMSLDQIEVLTPQTGISPDEGTTSGSNSMLQSGEAVRAACATARAHLLSLAAERLEENADNLEVSDGVVRAPKTNKTVSYAELIGDQPFNIPVDPAAPVKDESAYRKLDGETKARFIEDIVSGKHTYVHDMVVPGMLHARVVRPPHIDARLNKLDDGVVAKLEEDGLTVVQNKSFVAVAGEEEYPVIKAAERLFATADWDLKSGLETGDIYEQLLSKPRDSWPIIDGKPQLDTPVPPPLEAPAKAAITLSERFERPYHMHGSIGPSAALAIYDGKTLTIHTPSQSIYPVRTSMADAFGMDVEDVVMIHTFGAGCYGHNGADDAAFDAALIARAIPDTPVLLKWTREDEHAWEPYGTAMSMNITASLDDAGKILHWDQETYANTFGGRPVVAREQIGARRLLASRFIDENYEFPKPFPNMGSHGGIHRNIDPLYEFPKRRLIKNMVFDMPMRTSALRALGGFGNVFAIESMMDMLAEEAGADAVDFRLKHLKNERARDVVMAAAKQFGWGNETKEGTPEGTGHGFAFAQYKNAQVYTALAVELSVDDEANVHLKRCVIAGDAGQVVEPDGLIAQLEGGFVQAASWTLYEQVTYDSGGVTSRDWETYPILRFDNVPEIETILLPRPGDPFLGAGEGTQGPTAAAIANAIYRAIGIRLHRIPFTPDAIKQAAIG
ncbi:MAG: molybdopterin cofactor-binding domain-containing protein [Rhodospirillaceae bacterium]|jgi:nicotinate dehydrogenase subunit B